MFGAARFGTLSSSIMVFISGIFLRVLESHQYQQFIKQNTQKSCQGITIAKIAHGTTSSGTSFCIKNGCVIMQQISGVHATKICTDATEKAAIYQNEPRSLQC